MEYELLYNEPTGPASTETPNTTDMPNTTDYDYYDLYVEQKQLLFKIFLELFTILSLICIAVNLLICFVILKYRRLRKVQSNILLLHWTICNLFFMLSMPTTQRLLLEWTSHSMWVRHATFCVIEQVSYVLLFADIIFMELMTYYWYLKLYHPNTFTKYVRNITFSIVSVYIVAAFCLGLNVESCYNRSYGFTEVFLALGYLLYIIFMIIVNILHLFKRRRIDTSGRNIPLILTNIFLVSVIPSVFSVIIEVSIHTDLITDIVIMCSVLLICVMNPIYFFFVLYKFDPDYHTFFKHVITCQCRKYTEDELETTVTYNNKDCTV